MEVLWLFVSAKLFLLIVSFLQKMGNPAIAKSNFFLEFDLEFCKLTWSVKGYIIKGDQLEMR